MTSSIGRHYSRKWTLKIKPEKQRALFQRSLHFRGESLVEFPKHGIRVSKMLIEITQKLCSSKVRKSRTKQNKIVFVYLFVYCCRISRVFSLPSAL